MVIFVLCDSPGRFLFLFIVLFILFLFCLFMYKHRGFWHCSKRIVGTQAD